MVVNKSIGIEAAIQASLQEQDRGRFEADLRLALKGLHALTDWISYLRVAHDLKVLNAIDVHSVSEEKRDCARFPLPLVCRKIVAMRVSFGGQSIEVVPTNFSRRGMQLRSPVDLGRETPLACLLSTLSASGDEVSFRAVSKYSNPDGGSYLVGIYLGETNDDLLFGFFQRIHSLLLKTVSSTPQGHRPASLSSQNSSR